MSEALTIVIKEVTSAGGSAGDDKKSEKTQKDGFAGVSKGLSKMLTPLIAIVAGVALLSEALKPITSLLKYIFFIALYPILKLLNKIFPPETTELVARGAETLTKDNGVGTVTTDFLSGAIIKIDELKDESSLLAGVFAGFVATLLPLVTFWDTLKSAWFALGDVLSWLVETLKTNWPIIIQSFKDAWDGLVTFLTEKIPQMLKDAFDWISSTANDVKDWFVQGFEDVVNWGANIWAMFLDGLKGIADFGIDIWNLFLKGLEGIADFGNKIWKLFKSGLAGLAGLGSDIVNWVKKKLGFGGSDNSDPPKAFGGTVGHDGSYYLHAGESVNTPGQSTGGGNTFNINITGVTNSDDLVRKLTSEISRRVGR